MPDPYDSGVCRRIISSFFHQRPNITKQMEERLAASKNWVTSKIPYKGVVSQYDNSDDVRLRTAKQPFQHYRAIPSGPAALTEGTLPGRDCTGNAAMMPALVDTTLLNACNGIAEWNFAHGFALRTSQDMRFGYRSPTFCIEQYAQQGPEMVKAFFRAVREEFTKYGPDNFEQELRYLVVKNGESNASLTGSTGYFDVTTNGWVAPPTKKISIPFLDRYRQYMMGVEDGMVQKETDMLEIEIPRRDWFAAVADHILRTGGPAISMEQRFYTDERSQYYGKAFHEYLNIRAVFNDEPTRGYFRAAGTGYEFVEIYPWRNVRGETIQGAVDGGGLVAERNPDYWKNSIVCNGVTYPVVTIAWVLSPQAFERYGLSQSVAPAGVNPLGNNFEVAVEEPSIECNYYHNQFFLVSQHKARFKILKPALAGAIVYLGEEQIIMYDRVPCADESAATVSESAAIYDPLFTPPPDSCEMANCDVCDDGKVANSQGLCVADADGTLELEPCGTVEVVVLSEDDPGDLVVRVNRLGNLKDAAGVSYATADGTALDNTHYDGTSGSLSWAAGEGGYKDITIPLLLADAADVKQFTLTISSATGGASLGACTILTVQIQPTG